MTKQASKPRAEATPQEGEDMLKLLQDIALGRVEATALQVRAAIAAVQYTHTRTRDGGKKEGRQKAAEKRASGKFAPAATPRLVAAGGKPV